MNVKNYQSGAFDRKLTIQRDEMGTDEVGKPYKKESKSLFQLHCKYAPVSDGERLSHKHQSNLVARFTVRSNSCSSQIKKADYVIFEGVKYGIDGIKEMGRRKFFEITAVTHDN